MTLVAIRSAAIMWALVGGPSTLREEYMVLIIFQKCVQMRVCSPVHILQQVADHDVVGPEISCRHHTGSGFEELLWAFVVSTMHAPMGRVDDGVHACLPEAIFPFFGNSMPLFTRVYWCVWNVLPLLCSRVTYASVH